MSYASGMALGLCAGKKIHDFFSTCDTVSSVANNAAKAYQTARSRRAPLPRELLLVHALPGRRRYRSAALLGNDALAETIKTLLGTIEGVAEVSVNTRTGSVLCLYACSEERLDTAVHDVSSRYFCAEQAAPPVNPISETMRSLHALFCRLDQGVRSLTQNRFCLRSLLAAVFISRGLRKVFTLRQYPSGPQMLWWAFGLLRGWAVR